MLDKIVSDPRQKMLAAEKAERVIVMYPEFEKPFVVVEITKQPNAWHAESKVQHYLKQLIVHKKVILKNQFYRADCEKFTVLDWYALN